MSTNSNIAKVHENGTVTYIYCHWDGDLNHNGRILLNHYKDSQKIDQLIELGSLSCLGTEIGEKHDFDSNPQNMCTAYGRDRGEMKTEAKTCESLEDYLQKDTNEYCYIFKNKEWYFRTHKNKNLNLLSACEKCKENNA